VEERFEVGVERLPGTAVLTLRGDVAREATDELNAAYGRAVGGSDARRVVLDFSGTGYMNSSGIALIVSVLARARAEGRTVAAVGLTDHYRQIFEITRLSDFIDVCADLDAAVSGASPTG